MYLVPQNIPRAISLLTLGNKVILYYIVLLYCINVLICVDSKSVLYALQNWDCKVRRDIVYEVKYLMHSIMSRGIGTEGGVYGFLCLVLLLLLFCLFVCLLLLFWGYHLILF